MDGILSLDLSDQIVFVNTIQNSDRMGTPVESTMKIVLHIHTIQKRKQCRRVINDLDNVELFF